eukprot:TRINITY_DN10036_c0_g1_i1.p1 TRINITY_DN10036_c0_g1~~TRINITY_DN10036_c0_g1_i1.p1  ORF type:complete len:274 (-),score=76.43 TRINITY_DN10036_c0_g1_i1:145-966(-)
MGKSIRSKIKKRLRTAKRQRVDAMIITPREQEKHDKLVRVSQGKGVTLSTPKNAFKYPDAEDAVFPQHEVIKPIDFRAQNLPMAGTVFRGNRRKYNDEEMQMLETMKKSHPKMQVMAGGGAILAKTGKRVSLKEAALIATKVNKPEVAKVAEEELESAAVSSTAPADPVADDESMSDVEGGADDGPEPVDGADTSRRPVLKDARRAQRAAQHRTRPNSVKKTGNKQKAEEQQEATKAAIIEAKAAKAKAKAAASPSKPKTPTKSPAKKSPAKN